MHILTITLPCSKILFEASHLHCNDKSLKQTYTGLEFRNEFGQCQMLESPTMSFIIDDIKTTSDLYESGERVLLPPSFITVNTAKKQLLIHWPIL